MNLYHQALIDHYKNTSYKKLLPQADFSSAHYNPSCGDRVSFQGRVQDNNLVDLAFGGSGCVISQATASMLCEHFTGKDLADPLSFTSEQLQELIGITLGPHRLRCALIALQALQEGIVSYQTMKTADVK
ncbi:iron-sulfur cluster scaffold-like protein [Candidatus Dependentiae bacterium Noda2021]|nr:iron-sulfur cluster scaffold-like protein [Candidatus Dependentiae bacterium Noda2021]